jgi:pimeloyl-ACP methyl ester carboxylesterase
MGSRLNRKREFSLNINGMIIAGIAYGDPENTPILALHGWLDNAATFEQLASELSDQYILAIDFIGHGKSSHRDSNAPYYIWDNIVELSNVLDALELQRVSLLGHSMGASIAMMFAACFPQRVNRLFLIEGIAPLSYVADALPSLMGKAIRQRVKAQNRQAKGYRCFDEMITARVNGRFPVSESAAKLLVERGSIKKSDGYYWSSDSALLLPSINRMNELQIMAFLDQLETPVTVYLGQDGLRTELWDSYFKKIKSLKLEIFSGNHHLHVYPASAKEIAVSIESDLINSQ